MPRLVLDEEPIKTPSLVLDEPKTKPRLVLDTISQIATKALPKILDIATFGATYPITHPEKAPQILTGLEVGMKVAPPTYAPFLLENVISSAGEKIQAGAPKEEVWNNVIFQLKEYGKDIISKAKFVGGIKPKIDERKLSNYGTLYGNYYKSITGTEAPEWYKSLAGTLQFVGLSPTSKEFKNIMNTAIGKPAKIIGKGAVETAKGIAQLPGEIKQAYLNVIENRALTNDFILKYGKPAYKALRGWEKELQAGLGTSIKPEYAMQQLFPGVQRPGIIMPAKTVQTQLPREVLPKPIMPEIKAPIVKPTMITPAPTEIVPKISIPAPIIPTPAIKAPVLVPEAAITPIVEGGGVVTNLKDIFRSAGATVYEGAERPGEPLQAYLTAKTDLDILQKSIPNLSVKVKDVNGQRATFIIKDYIELVKHPEFTDRIREVWTLPKPTSTSVDPDFMEGIFKQLKTKLISGGVEVQPQGEVIAPIEGVELTNNSTIKKSQIPLFQNSVKNELVRNALKELGIKKVIIEPPYKFGLSEQANISIKNGVIKVNADATDPTQTILHELGHAKFESLSERQRSLLIERAMTYDNPEVKGYQKIKAWEEIIADSLFTRPDFAPEFYSKLSPKEGGLSENMKGVKRNIEISIDMWEKIPSLSAQKAIENRIGGFERGEIRAELFKKYKDKLSGLSPKGEVVKPSLITPKVIPAIEKLRQGKEKKVLDTKIRYDEGIMTRREFLEKAVNRGATSRIDVQTNKNAIERLREERKALYKNGMHNINAKKIAEIDTKIKEGVKKTEYHIVEPDETFLVVGKMEYDYFNSLKQPTQPKTGREGFIKVDLLNPAKWDNARQFIEDDWLRVKRLIQQKGANVTETNNPYEAEIRYWGRLGTRTEKADILIANIDKDIVTTSKKLKVSDKLLNKEIDRFLIARHAPERNAKHGDGAAGITTQEAQNTLIEISNKPYAKEVERIANRIQDLNNRTLDVLLESEVITKELYDELRTLYKNHIPLQRVMNEQDDIVEVLTRRGFDVQGAGLKRAKGSELEVADILTNVVANYKSALMRAEKNIVDNYTLRFARENDYFDGLFEEVKAKAIGKTFDGRIILEQIKDPKVLPVREKGNQVYLKINDPQLAMALRGVNRQKVDGLIRLVKGFTRFYAGLMTRFNPEFVVSNKIRDLQEVAVYLASKNEIGFKGTAEAIIKDPQSVKDVTDYIRGKDTTGARLYEQMKMDGGTTGGMGLSTREQLELDINKIRAINRSTPRKVAQIILQSIDSWNTIFEDSSRLSVYRQALKQDVSRNKAAVLAKEASVNFNKMGTGSPVINALYMFSNASVQGTAKMLRAMRNPKVLLTVLTLLGGAVFLINEYNDKKDKDWRKKVSKWDRLNGINIVISTDKGIKYVTIPISWGLKPIKVFFDEAGDLMGGHETSVSKAVGGLLASTIEAYNPAGGTDIVSAITPSILDLPVDIARNRSWTGGKIRPDWNNSAPASIQYFDNLRKKLSGQKFIEATEELGNKGIEISPADLNYAFEQLIGGAGRTVTKTLNTIVGLAQGKLQTKEIPFVSRFYRDIPEDQIREFGKDYEEVRKRLIQQDKDRFYFNQEAELVYTGLKDLPARNANANLKNMYETNRKLYDKIVDIKREDDLKLSYTDRLISKLGVENGQRAKYIWKKVNELQTAKEKNTYLKNLYDKKIITDEVFNQISYLKSRK